MSRQKTIRRPVEVSGKGLFGGQPTTMKFIPAPEESGIVFVRTDLETPVRLPVEVAKLTPRGRRTSLACGSVVIETVEHVLSAVSGLGIDNLVVEVNGAETPSIDGSPLPYAKALQDAGLEDQDVEKKPFIIEEPVTVSESEAMVAALPGPTDCLEILYDLDYSSTPSIGRQVLSFRLGKDDYLKEIAPARTFLLEQEAKEFQARGLGKHLTEKEILVMGPRGPVGNDLRFPDEHVRHKVADLIGDLMLLGRPVFGRIIARRSGHELNQEVVRKLLEVAGDGRRSKYPATQEPLLDVRRIMRLLPHRYPFLMVDRIIEMDGDRRAVGVKNVTINEQFFQGHYPGQPIMPGVLILEALAQLAGVLITRRLEHTGKVGFLVSMDRVKIRRPVVPGDQLILEAEALHVRSRTGHCKCQARVGDEVAAEAEIKFMLVDAEPV